ncbi:RNA polymerase sigma factor [Crassaminicella profunda]|uniref:RNA polymerase sigma factor n=1 Tax=Crassaminicella profunda TaxID=1286698 RepID=UPI001CA68155|nr:sigma-70 family RNA polymerase sigma factor [Crassaminicella profunda]QZY54909.1 sigma-70 family RNA polymerase sigma factor [Crassaminicella profunda]
MGIFHKKEKKDDSSLYLKILFDTYKDKVYRIAYYILKNEQDAKDVVQDTFITVYDRIHQLKNFDKIESWICVIASNTAKGKYNKKKKETLIDDDNKIIPFIKNNEDMNIPEELLMEKEFRSYLWEQINFLKNQYRETLILYYYGGLSYEEISEVTNTSLGTVKSRLYRAKENLKERILCNKKYDLNEVIS